MSASKNLLLVEDDAIIALGEARVLRNAGFAVKIVHDGESGVAAVRSDPSIDLVLMDIDLGPGLSGPEAAELILGLRSVPVVFLTSHSEREMVDKVRNITRYGYVIKNSGNFVLLSSIEMAFELLYEAHEEARRQARRSEAMLKAMPDLMFAVGRDGTIRDFFAPAGALLAVPSEQVVGTNIRDLFSPEEAERHLALYQACRDSGNVQTDSYELQIDGERYLYELRIARQDEDQILAIVRDITERDRSEHRLRHVTALYEHLFESSPVAVLVVDSDDRILKSNAAFTKLFGYTAQEALGSTANDLLVPEERRLEGRSNGKQAGCFLSPSRCLGEDIRLDALIISGKPHYSIGIHPTS